LENFFEWVVQHAEYSHWFLFGAILLAGINIPISVDLLMMFACFLAATIVPQCMWHLYLAVFLGCYLSAALGYWIGRLLGNKLKGYRWFNQLVSEKRIEKVQLFYNKYGFWTLIIGRFIPFGVRNCIFISTGLSRLSFIKFALWDLMACFIWSSLLFYLFFTLGKHLSFDFTYSKKLHFIGISIFSTLVIGLSFWYYRKKKSAI